jgi:hypothetical protein
MFAPGPIDADRRIPDGSGCSLTAEVTATPPHGQPTGLTPITIHGEVDAFDLGLSLN